MQTRDEGNNTLSTQVLDERVEKAAQQLKEALEQPGVKSVAIGGLPDKGDIFTLNGLHYQVKFVDYKRGELRIKLYTPAKTL